MMQDIPPNDRGGSRYGGPFSEVTVSPDAETLVDTRAYAQDAAERLANDFARYREFRPLGRGGAGDVKQCRDPHLGRVVALKVMHEHLQSDAGSQVRFVREARVMAQLEHPNIVPVHELGRDAKGALYFSMKRIEGQSLKEILDNLSAGDEATTTGYPLHRLLDILVDVGQAVAFAHSRGVVHRDLKPSNILIGAFGEVLLLDWGLAKVLGAPDPEASGQSDMLQGVAASEIGGCTIPGQVAGTPLYMSPEQARGDANAVDERSDVYSLGAILYEMLTHRYTVTAWEVREIIRAVIRDDIPPPRVVAPDRRIPRELDAICMKALAKDASARYPSVAALLQDVEAHRAGLSVAALPDSRLKRGWKWCRRHPVISSTTLVGLAVFLTVLALVTAARVTRYRTLMAAGHENRIQGTQRYQEQRVVFDAWRALDAARTDKLPSDRETELRERLTALEEESEDFYEAAVILYLMAGGQTPEPDRYPVFREIFDTRLAYALHTGRYRDADRWLDFIRRWLGNGFEHADEELRRTLLDTEAAVRGDGTLALDSLPTGARVTLWTSVPDARGVLKPTDPTVLGTTPLAATPLPKGRYLLTLAHDRRAPVTYPLLISHGEQAEAVIRLPEVVPEGMVYVPGSAFLMGGAASRYERLHPVTLPDFFIKQYEVTFGEFLQYWRDPEGGASRPEDVSRVRLDPDQRRYEDAWDTEGRPRGPFDPSLPVVGVNLASAERYCAWLTRRLGRTCRLPTAAEWEKAARGVDGRAFVWGDAPRADLALNADHAEGRARFGWWAPPGSFPDDCSVYQAFDLAGNVRELTSTPFPGRSGFHQLRGASGSTPKEFLPCALASDTPVVPSDVGFRYVMPLE